MGAVIENDYHREIKQELMRMCQLITGRLSTLCFFAGSSVEIPDPPTCRAHDELGIDRANDDVDMMYYSTNICAFNQLKQVPESFVGEIKRIDTSDIHPGYAKLLNDIDYLESDTHATLINFSFDNLRSLSFTRGPATQTNFLQMLGPLLTLGLHFNFRVSEMEAVFAVHSPYWPDEASEWVARTRHHDFPSKRLIKRIVQYGCDFVRKSPMNESFMLENVSTGDIGEIISWRFSFSMAEYKIIQQWTTSQRIVYRTLRLIHKIMKTREETKLCTYHFKTLMLWECERRAPEFWEENSLQCSVSELLETMILWLKDKNYPNYFIPENNMIDHLRGWEIEISLTSLQNISPCDIQYGVLKHSVYNEELICSTNVHYQVELPCWLYRSLVMFDHVLSSATKRDTRNGGQVSPGVQEVLKKKLYDVCHGLYFHKKSTLSEREVDAQKCIALSKEHLTKAACLFESPETCFIELSIECKPFRGLVWLTKFIVNTKPLECEYTESFGRSDVLHPNFVARRTQYQRGDQNNKDTSGAAAGIANARLYSVFNGSDRKTIYEGYVPNFPGFMPTVSLSWFVARAYLANLMYTNHSSKGNYDSMLQLCKEIMDVYKQSMLMHPFFADLMMPVSLSTQWTSVYDADIQYMLGFYSLCSLICDENDHRDQSRREVDLGICPVQFSIYLKLRYSIDENRVSFRQKSISDWSTHKHTCTSDRNANNARDMLVVILRNHGVNIAE